VGRVVVAAVIRTEDHVNFVCLFGLGQILRSVGALDSRSLGVQSVFFRGEATDAWKKSAMILEKKEQDINSSSRVFCGEQ